MELSAASWLLAPRTATASCRTQIHWPAAALTADHVTHSCWHAANDTRTNTTVIRSHGSVSAEASSAETDASRAANRWVSINGEMRVEWICGATLCGFRTHRSLSESGPSWSKRKNDTERREVAVFDMLTLFPVCNQGDTERLKGPAALSAVCITSGSRKPAQTAASKPFIFHE